MMKVIRECGRARNAQGWRKLGPRGLCGNSNLGQPPYEYDYEYSPTGFMAVRFDSNVDLTVHPDERRTMSKKHRKMVLEGINNLNNHDRVMQSSLGMQPQVSNGTSGVAVITSHPTLFQDFFEHTYS